jgi:hypothetical protein
VGRVEHEQRADLVRDLAERLGVDDPRVGGGAGHDDLRAVLAGEVPDLVEVDPLVARRDAVADEPVQLPAGVDRRAVGEVPALVEAHAEDGVARLQEGEVHGHVGVGPGVGLDVGVRRAEELPGAGAGQLLDLVDDLVAAVVALGGVPLAVLVGEHRAGRPQHLRRGEVLAGDELHRRVLPLELALDQAEHLVVRVLGPGHGD